MQLLVIHAITAVLSSVKVLVVSSAVQYDGWYWAADIAAVKQNLSKSNIDIEILAPTISDKTIASRSNLTSLKWGGAEMRENVIKYLTSQPADIIMTIADPLMNNSTLEQIDVRFIHIQLTGSPTPVDPPPDMEVINLSLLKGSYLSGIAAGLYAIQHTRTITTLVRKDSPDENRNNAFYKGIKDVSKDICIKSIAVDPTVTNYATQVAEAIENSTVIMTSLREYNEEILDIVSDRLLDHYSVSSVTDPLVGSLSKSSRVPILVRSVIDWNELLIKIANSGVTASTWTSQDDTDISTISWLLSQSEIVERVSSTSKKGGLITASKKSSKHMQLSEGVSNDVKSTACDGNTTIEGVLETIERTLTSDSYADAPKEIRVDSQNCSVFSPVKTNTKVSTVAQQCTPRPGGTVKLVGVGVYATTLGTVDMSGSVYVDFNLYLHRHKGNFTTAEEVFSLGIQSDGFTCKESLFTEEQWDEFISETDTSSSSIFFPTMDEKKEITHVTGHSGKIEALRVQGSHLFKPEIKDWPFDTQNIKISVEETSQSTSENITLVFCHLPSHSGISPSARYFPGSSFVEDTVQWAAQTSFTCWPYLKKPYDYAKGLCNTDPSSVFTWENLPNADLSCTCLGGTRPSSRYTWSFLFVRPLRSTLMKIFMPPVTITIVQMGVWWMTPSSSTQRLRLCGSSLVSSVMFHSSLSGHIPPTSQVTVADRFMLVVYWSNFLAFFGVYIESCLVQAGLENIALASHRFTRLYGILTTLFAFVGFFATNTLSSCVVAILSSNVVIAVLISASGYMKWCHSAIGNHLVKKNEILELEKAARYQKTQSVQLSDSTDELREMSPRRTLETDIEIGIRTQPDTIEQQITLPISKSANDKVEESSPSSSDEIDLVT